MEDGVRVLENLGVENYNTDGAAFNYYITSGRSMIVAGVGRECIVEKINDNTVELAPGELIIHGFRVRIEKAKQFTISLGTQRTQYSIIATIKLKEDKTVDFYWLMLSGSPGLKQDNLFVNNTGTYQVKIASFFAGISNPISSITQELKVGFATESVAKKLDCPLSPNNELWTIPRIKPGTTNEVSYLGSTQGAGGNTIAIRDPDGSMRAAYIKGGPYTTDHTLINQGGLNAALALLSQAKIMTGYVSAGSASSSEANKIGINEYGLFVIKGGNSNKITLGSTAFTTGMMLIWKYRAGDSSRAMYIYQSTLSVSSGETAISTDITITAGTDYGTRIVKIPMAAI